jgi:cytochrome P450
MSANSKAENTVSIFDDPYPFYAQLRENDPVHFHEAIQAWFLLRYEDVVRCLKDTTACATGETRPAGDRSFCLASAGSPD